MQRAGHLETRCSASFPKGFQTGGPASTTVPLDLAHVPTTREHHDRPTLSNLTTRRFSQPGDSSAAPYALTNESELSLQPPEASVSPCSSSVTNFSVSIAYRRQETPQCPTAKLTGRAGGKTLRSGLTELAAGNNKQAKLRIFNIITTC